MSPPLVTLTTDFGLDDTYVAEMKGVLLSLAPQVVVVDVTHGIPPQDVTAGALALARAARHFPPHAIHVAVVDPGVGTERPAVYAEVGTARFVAPDNGLLGLVARRDALRRVVRLAEPRYWLPEVSATFHGRDVFAPVAARLALGLDPALLGPPHLALAPLAWPEAEVGPHGARGVVMAIDRFGNCVTNLSAEHVPPQQAAQALPGGARWRCGKIDDAPTVRTYGQAARGAAVALVGSAGWYELAVVCGSAAETGGVRVGDVVECRW